MSTFSVISNGYNRFKGRPMTRPEGNCSFAERVSPSRLDTRETTLANFQHPLGMSSFTSTMSPAVGKWED